MDIGLQTVRLWVTPAEALLTGDIGIVPLAPLGQMPADVSLRDNLADINRCVVERLIREAPLERMKELLTASHLLTSSGMVEASPTPSLNDPFDLNRFTSAQEAIYEDVLAELRSGRKRTHWMWFIFPQIDGLGYSSTARHFAIKSLEEARQYLAHPVLGPRLLECADAVLAIKGRSVSEILGYPDDLKLKSSMTLFALVSDPGSVFARVLDKYFGGERDEKTLEILDNRNDENA